MKVKYLNALPNQKFGNYVMKDKCILVTGSSSGIGRSITERLLNSGAKVIGLARDHSKFTNGHQNYLTYPHCLTTNVQQYFLLSEHGLYL